jgi:CheY-like chemotaxis protein
MTADVWTAVPALVWAALIAGVVFLFRDQIRELIPRLRAVSVAGFGAEFGDAVEKASAERGKPVDSAVTTAVERRAARDAAVIADARIIWVDDNPDNNVRERQALRALGIDVENATSTSEALVLLRRRDRDLVLSDMDRDSDAQAGLALLAALSDRHTVVPVIFYVGEVDPTLPVPPGAAAITDHPVALMHAIFDVLERDRG